MPEQPQVLDYATPGKRPASPGVTPRNVALAGLVITLLSLLLPYDIGSGRVIPNPLRILGCVAAVACAGLYALLRLWGDPQGGLARKVVLSVCFVTTVASFTLGHSSVSGGTRLPPLELRFAYWRFMAVAVAAILVSIAFCTARWLWGLVRAAPPSEHGAS